MYRMYVKNTYISMCVYIYIYIYIYICGGRGPGSGRAAGGRHYL